MGVRAKFRCDKITKDIYGTSYTQTTVHFNPVADNDNEPV